MLLPIAHARLKRIEEAQNAPLIGKIHQYRRNIVAAVGEKRVGGSCLFSNRLEYPRSQYSFDHAMARGDRREEIFRDDLAKS